MKMTKMMLAAVLILSCGAGATFALDDNLFERAPWFASLGLNYYHLEGDVQVKPGIGFFGNAGYSLNSWWDMEGSLYYMPSLSARSADDLNDNVEPLDGSTSAFRMSVDALLHLRGMENRRLDPFLRAGPSITFYGDKLTGGKTQLGLFGGVGLFYHFDDSWALRGDLTAGVQGDNADFNALLELGVTYRFGAVRQIAPVFMVEAGPGDVDSDGDGLFDKDEAMIGTDPYNPDTDADGLSDGDEHFQYKTNPLDPDTDMDSLKDGAEVLTYTTDPLNVDTDGGGVSDGHEVIEDDTDPLDPADDLQKFTLLIEFDYDKSFIRPEYFTDIVPVIKVLQRDPSATVRVEGHADKRPKSSRKYNQRLSEKRARAVADYIIEQSGIATDQVTVAGYGFDRPVMPNDTEEHMQHNRRTDIYIRKGGE